MKSFIYELDKDGKVNLLATYTIKSKQALVDFIKQQNDETNNIDCSDIINKIRECKIKKNAWLCDDLKNNRTLVAYED